MIKLTVEQKDEIRRLTQRANRRIQSTMKVYQKAGRSIIPAEIAGRYQTLQTWEEPGRPLSRSVKFDTLREYRRRLAFLKGFDDVPGARPSIREYTRVQRKKVMMAVETATGRVPSKDLIKRVRKMSAVELSNFWEVFSEKASKLGLQYSSDSVIQESIQEFFEEDIDDLIE